MARVWTRSGLVGLAVVAVVAIGCSYAFPAVAAIAWPSGYGFDRLADGVYVDRGASAEERSDIDAVVDAARAKVGRFYGRLESAPRVMICTSEACYRRVGGGASRGMAILDWALFLSPRGTTATIATHELSHIELHHRIGLLRTWRRDIPQWFDEGLAVTISDDPRYLAPPGAKDRCLIDSSEPLPSARRAWIESAASHDLYAKAACRVSRWLARRGGGPAIVDLADRIAAGQSFESIYR